MSARSLHYVKDRERLERVQHRFTRMVPGLKGLDYGGRLERLKLMTLEERRNRSDLVELFKMSKGLSAIPWNLFFHADNSGRTRGHSKKLGKGKIQVGCQETLLFSKSGESMEWTGRGCDIGRYSGYVQEKIGGTEDVEEGSSYGLESDGPKADSRQLGFGRSR